MGMQRAAWAGSLVIAASLSTLMYASGAAFAQTPTPAVPSAPTGVQFLGGVLTWSDNADNEDGYKITVQTRSDIEEGVRELTFEVGANVTSFPLPAEARLACPDRISVELTVIAFNEAGSSDPARFAIFVLCPAPTGTAVPPLPTATAVPPLPNTGTGGSAGIHLSWLIAGLALAGAGALAAAAALGARGR